MVDGGRAGKSPRPDPLGFRPGLGGGEGKGVEVGGWGGGGGEKGFSQKVGLFNYFRHDKPELDLTDDCIFTVLLNFLPNGFRPEMEPHELVWKSVTAILHRFVTRIFKVFF